MLPTPPHHHTFQAVGRDDEHPNKKLYDLMLHKIEHYWGDVFGERPAGNGRVPHIAEVSGDNRQVLLLKEVATILAINPQPSDLTSPDTNVVMVLQQVTVSAHHVLCDFALDLYSNIFVHQYDLLQDHILAGTVNNCRRRFKESGANVCLLPDFNEIEVE